MRRIKFTGDTIFGLAALAAYILSIFLNWESFFPTLGEINPWDEAAYVHGGHLLLQGTLPNFAGSPLSALLYAIANLIFTASPFWMLKSVAAIRLVAYSLVWLSAFLIGKQIKQYVSPLILCGMLLAAPFLTKMLRFPTDPLFVGFAALGLWQMIIFHQTGSMRSAIYAGLLIALSAAARNDGLVLFFAGLAWLSIQLISRHGSWLSIVGYVLPFICIVGGYIVLYGALTGNYSLGTAERTYDNFEAGQIAVYSGEAGVNAAVDAKREARRLFGTPDENDYSVARAIVRNPAAYLERVKRVTLELPGQVIKAYSGKWVVVFVFWVIWGISTLIRKRDWSLFILLILWISPFLSGFVITIFRTGHLLFPSLVLITLAGIGLNDYSTHSTNATYRSVALIGMGSLLFIGLASNEWVVIYAATLSLIALLLTMFAQALKKTWLMDPKIPLILMLIVGLILHGPFPGFGSKRVELPVEEQALLVMQRDLPPGARILAGSPGVIYAAKMTYLGIASTDVPIFNGPAELREWLQAQQVDGIYIDRTFTLDNAAYWDLLSSLQGEFTVAFQDTISDIQVWITR